jgi:hypothetical protein
VYVSVTWTWDKRRGEELAESWRGITSNVTIGGPAYDDPGGEFEPGMYLKHGYTITSRGCPNHCWFCAAWKREGNIARELVIKEGYNVLDSNLLACSEDHIKRVFEMLERQPERPRFTGGLEAARMKPWIAEQLRILKPETAYFAYDTPDDYEPLVVCSQMLKDVGITNSDRAYSCYVLIGYEKDTFEKAERRLKQVLDLGLMPMAMLFNKAEKKQEYDRKQWIKFQREYANRVIVGSKLSAARTAASLS